MRFHRFRFTLPQFMLIVALAGILISAGMLILRPSGEPECWASALAFSPDGKSLAASAYVYHNVQVWSPTPRVLGADANHTFLLLSVPDLHVKRVLDRSTRPGTISVAWPVRKMGLGQSLAFSPDGTAVATKGLDNVVSIWTVRSGEKIRELSTTAELSGGVSWAGDGTLAASASDACYVLRKDVPTLQKATSRGRFVSVALSPDGKNMVTADDDGKIELWDTQRGRRLRELDAGGFPFAKPGLAVSHDGLHVAAGSVDFKRNQGSGVVRVWEAASGSELLATEMPLPIVAVAFSPDDSTLAASGVDGKLRLLSLNGGENDTIDVGATISAIAFSSDGTVLATGDSKGRVCLWDPASKQLLSQALLHRGWTVPHWLLLVGASIIWYVLWRYVRHTPTQQLSKASCR